MHMLGKMLMSKEEKAMRLEAGIKNMLKQLTDNGMEEDEAKAIVEGCAARWSARADIGAVTALPKKKEEKDTV